LAVCNTQENIIFLLYMYICHIASKTWYSKYKIFIFYNTKEKPDLKINMIENHKSPFLLKRSQKRGIKTCSLFHRFLFLQYKKKKKKNTHTQKKNTHALPGYCSSELNFTWTVTNATQNACKSWE
jgi:hypothetical protein